MLLLPVETAVLSTLAGIVPLFAARLLAPCNLAEAECALLKVLKQLATTYACAYVYACACAYVCAYACAYACACAYSLNLLLPLLPQRACMHQCVWLQLIDGCHYFVRVSVHSKRANLPVFNRTLVSCTLALWFNDTCLVPKTHYWDPVESAHALVGPRPNIAG